MKKILLGFLIIFLFSVCKAETEYTDQQEFLKAVPKIVQGVQIVPPSEMYANDPETLQQMKTKGYIESNTPNPQGLMRIKERAPSVKLINNPDPENYYLKKELKEIKLSFSYKEISDPAKRIGFAPVGKNIKRGWTGVREFFEDADFGVCSLTTFHLKDSQMSIRINSELVTYAIHHFPTTVEAEGNKKSGFIYTVSWVTYIFSKDFECAKMVFDKDMIKKMIYLANKTMV